MQLVVPCALVQALPQTAQLVTVPSCVSQPAPAPQSAKPELHVPMVQVPVEHDAAAFANAQATLQSPQSVVVRRLRSQPLSGLPSQLLKPVSHAGEQSKLPAEPVQVFEP